ncbi:MAG TPA: L-glutamate gamma-semialdehyde dehydrogenase [Blastocatellia bacterium]|nr:L-glutamate gamma-semialdehyde dehydrogenase [Blastocatellia bacterium]
MLNLAPFKNEPYADFSDQQHARAMREAIELVESQLGREYEIIIGGERFRTGELLESVNPAKFSQVIGRVHHGTRELADRAIRAAWQAFETWKHVPAEARANYLFQAAAKMRRRKSEFNAWMVYEVGKSWAEAEADTAEAIDFMEFYARQALRYAAPQPLTPSPLAFEANEMSYIPLGVGIVIPPWNFPLAILAGMTTAAIVTGNTVVLKPSDDSPIIGAKFMELMEEVSLPPGVINFLPADGPTVGEFLVEHPQTRFISFTGSMAVGLRINELAAKPREGQIWIKRVVAEMGGKDTVVVDETADLDEAAAGIVASAFGFSGQKCSAGSRAVIVEAVYDQVLEKVLARTGKLSVGPVTDGTNFTGPVSSRRAFEKINHYLEIGRQEGRLLTGGGRHELAKEGYFIPLTVFGEIDPRARLAQEEIFGPVLACIKARDVDEALAIANNTLYGLTGAFYSSSRERLERARREFHVGNLYLNRKCTGALVDVHPFGGFNMSGTDSKAGGRDYLGLFLQAKSIAEKL